MILPRVRPCLLSAHRRLGLLLGMLVAACAADLRAVPDQDFSTRDFTGFHLGTGSEFGSTLATSGDWLAVGAPGTSQETRSTYSGGRVILYKIISGQRIFQQQLLCPETVPGVTHNQFGTALVMDGTRLLVGAGKGMDAAYVYSLQEDGVWTLESTLRPPSGVKQGFGKSLALSGDRAVVGTNPRVSSMDSGYLDVYTREATGWVHEARLSDGITSYGLGLTVALQGDTLFAGAPFALRTVSPFWAPGGKVVVFQRTSGTWAKSRELLAEEDTSGQFGGQVVVEGGSLYVLSRYYAGMFMHEFSLSGDFSLTTSRTLGTPYHDGPFTYPDDITLAVAPGGNRFSVSNMGVYGRPVIYYRFNQTWDPAETDLTRILHHKRALAWSSSGTELLLGGYKTYAPTVPGDDKMVASARMTGLRWEITQVLRPMSTFYMDATDFGFSLSADGDWLVVGSPSLVAGGIIPNVATLKGLVYVYRKEPDGSLRFHSLLPAPVVSFGPSVGRFGQIVACSGGRIATGGDMVTDIYGDLVGAPVVVYAWDAATDTWVQEATFTPPLGPAFNAPRPISAVALSGDLLAIGCANGDLVRLYRRSGSTWTLETALTDASYSGFGQALSLDGEDRLLCSTTDRGAFLYERQGGTWTRTAQLTTTRTMGSWLGLSVSLHRDHAYLGGESGRGGILFERSSSGWQEKLDIPPVPGAGTAYGGSVHGSLAAVNGVSSLSIFRYDQGQWLPTIPTSVQTHGTHSARGLQVRGSQIFYADAPGAVRLRDLSLPPTIWWEGTATQTQSQGGVTHLDAGEYLVGGGRHQALDVSVYNPGAVAFTLTSTVEGDLADCTFTPLPGVLQAAHQTLSRLSIHPRTPGEKQITLRLASSATNDQPRTYVIHVRGVTQVTPLQFVEVPQSMLTEGTFSDGQPLSVKVTGTRPWRFRWFKNRLPITGGNTDSIVISSPGRYEVEVTNPAGKILSPFAAMGTYQPLVPEVYGLVGETARLTVAVAGPGIQVRWLRDTPAGWAEITDRTRFSGMNSPVLSIRNGAQDVSGGYMPVITLPTPSGTPLTAEPYGVLYQSYQRPSVYLAGLEETGRMFVGQPAFLECGLWDGLEFFQDEPLIYSVTGLPPGLTATPDGIIEGTPTQAGTYLITASARIGRLQCTRTSRRFTVSESGLHPPGFYWGRIEQVPGFPLDAVVTLDLRSDGTYTGSLQGGTARTPFTGRLTAAGSFRTPAFRLSQTYEDGLPLVAWVHQTDTENVLALSHKPQNAPDDEAIVLTELILIRSRSVGAPPAEQLGRHNFAFSSPANPQASPAGSGFGTLTITADHRITCAGQFPEGGTFTSSGWLGCEPDGTYTTAYLYVVDAAGKSSMHGAVPLVQGAAAPLFEGGVTCNRLPSQGRLYPEGYSGIPSSFTTSRYNPATAAQLLSSQPLQLSVDPYTSAPFKLIPQFSPQLKVTFSGPNPARLKLDVTAATGFFTGQYTLRDLDPADELGIRVITRTINFRGILLPEARSAFGTCLVPFLPDPYAEPPTTSATSPVISGSLSIRPATP